MIFRCVESRFQRLQPDVPLWQGPLLQKAPMTEIGHAGQDIQNYIRGSVPVRRSTYLAGRAAARWRGSSACSFLWTWTCCNRGHSASVSNKLGGKSSRDSPMKTLSLRRSREMTTLCSRKVSQHHRKQILIASGQEAVCHWANPAASSSFASAN